MQWMLLLLAVYIAAILQAAFDSILRVGNIVPDWFAVVALLTVLTVRRPRPLTVGLLVGFAADLSAAGPLGISTALLSITTLSVAHLRRKLHIEHPTLQVPLIASATTLYALGVMLIANFWSTVTHGALATLLEAAGVGTYTAALALPVLMITAWTREPRPLRSLQMGNPA